MPYDLKPMRAPRAAGALLKTFTALVENPATARLLQTKLLRDAGILALRDARSDAPIPTTHPVFAGVREQSPPGARASVEDAVSLAAPEGPFETAADFERAYRDGQVTPTEVAERVLAAVEEGEARRPPMRTFIAQRGDDVRAQAEASAERWRQGTPLSPLDGVPVAVKDELDQAGYPTTVGTRFLAAGPVAQDATAVARLRAAGAVLLGKANMHEIGLGVTGLNPHHGAARNPYDPSRATGGSSSGPAAAVAAGLGPLSVGADGGGSIRIPSALCGVVGLKATFGRVSEHGAAPLCWSVAHVGPIAATVRDCALGYAVMAGPDPADANSTLQPAPTLAALTQGPLAQGDLRGVRLGVYRAWFEDAEPDVVARAQAGLDALVAAGAEVVDVEIPHLALLRAVHLVTIISEMAGAHVAAYRDHRKEYGLDTRLNLSLARSLRAFDYVHAQRHRARIQAEVGALLARDGGVDAIVTPTTARTAPPLPDDALATGESNLPVVDAIMRYAHTANLTGLPALSVPVGVDGGGLPVGLQLLGRAWEEDRLLALGRVVEAATERPAPRVHARLLPL